VHVPEGHTIHRLARDHKRRFGGQVVRLSSPQGRFADGAALLDGRTLAGTEAHGKHLFHRFSGGLWLHVHLGLYGKFQAGQLPAPAPIGALRLRVVGAGYWADLRGPTACEVITGPDRTALIARLGPDPLRRNADPDRAWTRLSRSRTPVGALVMDQTVLSGVGNVYRAEVLFRAGINPYRPGRELDPAEWATMWADLVTLMRAGVRTGRIVTSRPEHRARRGRVTVEDAHYVYRRAGLPCRVCRIPVRTAILVGRNLFWCERCQR
jgi:endonuclease-8